MIKKISVIVTVLIVALLAWGIYLHGGFHALFAYLHGG